MVQTYKQTMKILFIFLSLLPTLSVRAQVTNPPSPGEGKGVGFTLQQLKDSALHNNIAIRNAELSIDAAREQRKEAFTKYFPNVSATGLTFNANRGMAKMEMNPSEMMPVQPVFVGGQIVNGNKLAKVGEDVSRLQLQLSENEVEETVEQYYWKLVSLQEKTKTLDAVDTLLANIYKDVDVAVRAGVAMRNDLLQVQLRQNDIESQRLKLENGISIVRLLLAQYCGLNNEQFSVESIEHGDGLSPHAIKQDCDQALLATAEYQLLNKQIEATDLQRKMEIGKNLPTVAVGAGYNYHNLMDNDRTFGMIFATVSVPITDWWGGSHAIKRKKIEHQKAIEQLEDNTQLLQIRMQNAWNGVQESYQQLQLAQRGIEQAEENLRLNRDYYRAGTSRMADLLEAQLLYQQACDKRTDAFADHQIKLLEYRHSVGQ